MPSEILIYQTENQETRIEVKLDGDTIWLTQKQMAELFQKSIPTINEHIKNTYSEGELESDPTIRKFLIVQTEGTRAITREVEHYNLDVIISVGYRVKSLQGTKFRIWATQRLREYLVKGFVMDDERLAEGRIPAHYFEELVERIREIRASEWNFYRKLLSLFSMATDYDLKSEAAREFFAAAQNKLHFAVHSHTAAELVAKRADAGQPNMGLTSFKGKRPRRKEVSVAKNYLDGQELKMLNLLISQYLDFAELQARSGKPMSMADWSRKLDGFIQLNERQLLRDAGKISAKLAKELAEAVLEEYLEKKGDSEIGAPYAGYWAGLEQLPHGPGVLGGIHGH